MHSRAKLLGHPIHQMLIVFPLGLLAMAVVFATLLLSVMAVLPRVDPTPQVRPAASPIVAIGVPFAAMIGFIGVASAAQQAATAGAFARRVIAWSIPNLAVIVFLAGLQGIPQEYYDAASVDGAARWARFRHVTLPLLTPSLFFTGILSLIGSFQVFDQVYILARPGKPTEATITLVYYIYESGFKFFRMGQAAAASWILFLIVAVLTVIYFRSQRRWVHYQ